MAFLTYFLPLILVPLATGSPTELTSVLENALQDAEFRVIGQVGTKVFFETVSMYRGMAASSVCTQGGFQPGILNGRDELNWLQQQRPNTHLWLGGGMSDSTEPRQGFQWHNGEPISDDINFMIMSSNWLCLKFFTHVTYAEPCLPPYGVEHQVLCQLVV